MAVIAGITAGVIARKLGEGLVHSIGGAAGSELITIVFMGGPPTYFEKVYKEVEKIAKRQMDGSRISAINGQIQALIRWIDLSYNKRKKAGLSKRELHDMLQPHVATLAIKIVGPLMDDDFSEVGLGACIIASSVHLLLLQELALVDPHEDQPEQSSFIETLKDYALIYAKHLEETYIGLVATRRNLIKEVFVEATFSLEVSRWEDEFTGEEFITRRKANSELKNSAFIQRKNYITGVISKLNESLYRPMVIADHFRKLLEQPIPRENLATPESTAVTMLATLANSTSQSGANENKEKKKPGFLIKWFSERFINFHVWFNKLTLKFVTSDLVDKVDIEKLTDAYEKKNATQSTSNSQTPNTGNVVP